MPPRSSILLLTAFLVASPGGAQVPYLVEDLSRDTANAFGSQPESFRSIRADRALFTTASPYSVWATDGTSEGTVPVLGLCPGDGGPTSGNILAALPGLGIVRESCTGSSSGTRLWSTDGTATGTVLLPVDREQIFTNLFWVADGDASVLDNRFLFIAREDDSAPFELWSTDGTADGTGPIAALSTSSGHFLIEILAAESFALVFLRGSEASELWRTDGSPAGTYSLGPLPFELWWETPQRSGDRLFFKASTEPPIGDDPVEQLWITDGTVGGTRQLTHFTAPSIAEDLLRVGGGSEALFVSRNSDSEELWRSDGTVEGTFPVTDFSEPYPFADLQRIEATWLDGQILFLGRGSDGYLGLWESLGPPGAAPRIRKIAPAGIVRPEHVWIESVGARVVFTGYSTERGWEAWTSDGTAAGTAPLADACAGLCDSNPAEIAHGASGDILFTALDELGRRQPWTTDGSATGTHRPESEIRRFANGYQPGRALDAAALSGGWLLSAADGVHGLEPWRVDSHDTTLLRDIVHDTPGLKLQSVSVRGEEIAFSTKNSFEFGRSSVYRSEGTPGTTAEIERTHIGSCGIASPTSAPQVVSLSRAIVLVHDACYAYLPIDSWLRETGTVVTLFPYEIENEDRFPIGTYTRADELLIFIQSPTRTEIWSSDGTPAGTVFRSEFPAGWYLQATSKEIRGRIVLDLISEDYLATKSLVLDVNDWELYEIPGLTAALGIPILDNEERLFYQCLSDSQPALVCSFDPGDLVLRPFLVLAPGETLAGLETWGSSLLFATRSDEPGTGPRLWTSDGTAEGIRLVTLLPPSEMGPFGGRAGGRFFFVLAVPDATWGTHLELWSTDGTDTGTRHLADLFRDGEPETQFYFQPSEDRLYFFAGAQTWAAWSSDGTANGTGWFRTLVPADQLPGEPYNPYYPGYRAIGDELVFAHSTPEHGWELWISGGTPETTRPLADIRPGPESSLPADFHRAGHRLFFTADDGVHGRELWALDLSGEPCQPSATRLCLLEGRFALEMSEPSGLAAARPLTELTGSFARTPAGAPDAFVKFADGNATNGHQWLFAADLVPDGFSLRILDTANGRERIWSSSNGELASFADDAAFESFPVPLVAAVPPAAFPASSNGAGCVESATRLCFAGGRIAVEASGVGFDGATLAARSSALDLGADQGGYWLFDPALLELVVRVEEPAPGRFALAVASLTNLGYAITATDLLTGAVRTVDSSAGQFRSQAVDDLFGAAP